MFVCVCLLLQYLLQSCSRGVYVCLQSLFAWLFFSPNKRGNVCSNKVFNHGRRLMTLNQYRASLSVRRIVLTSCASGLHGCSEPAARGAALYGHSRKIAV